MMPALVLQYRIAVLGASGVGKSSIVSQFVNDQFQGENSNAMREGLQMVDYDFPGMGLSLEFRDTTCSDDYAW
nr:hypothetical protein BaRGS_034342 [Batillaria attramentaria]